MSIEDLAGRCRGVDRLLGDLGRATRLFRTNQSTAGPREKLLYGRERGSGARIALLSPGLDRHQRADALLVGYDRLRLGSFEFGTALPDQIQECGHGYHRGCGEDANDVNGLGG
jgi:hypothetical protein